VGADLGEGQLGDLPQEGFEPAVFGNPALHLGQEFLGDVDGAGFAVLFAGQVVAGMALALLAMAAGASALFVNEDQAGGQDGAAGLKGFGAGEELSGDEGGVSGDVHGDREPGWGLAYRISIYTYPKRQGKTLPRRVFPGGGGGSMG